MNYVIDDVKYSWDSRENQEIRRKFVEREVIYCVSYLVSEVVKKCECWDEFPHLFERLNYEYVVYDELKYVFDEQMDEMGDMDEEDLEDYIGPWDDLAEEWDIATEDKESPQTFLDALEETIRLEEFASDRELEPGRDEVYEHWIVTDHLANLLEQQDEAVERDFFGLTIWGRCTTGQSIFMDGLIGRICYNRGILQGQENSWEEAV